MGKIITGFVCAILFLANPAIAQKFYLDEQGEEISKDEFLSLKADIAKYVSVNVLRENQKRAKQELGLRLVIREQVVSISKEEHKAIMNALQKNFGADVDPNQYTAILFDPGTDPIKPRPKESPRKKWWEKRAKQELEFFDSQTEFQTFYIKKLNSYNSKEAYYPFKPDLGGLIEQTFFSEYHTGYSYVVIAPNGHSLIYYDEFYYEDVSEKMKTLRDAQKEK